MAESIEIAKVIWAMELEKRARIAAIYCGHCPY
jgi:hypothetical protein